MGPQTRRGEANGTVSFEMDLTGVSGISVSKAAYW